jgi:hypothetical protein
MIITVQTPVTGREYNGDKREALQALAHFYSALNSRNIEMMHQNRANSAEIAMDNPVRRNQARLERDQNNL